MAKIPTFLLPQAIHHEIDLGEGAPRVLKFRPARLREMAQLGVLLKGTAKSLATLLRDPRDDTKVTRRTNEDAKDGFAAKEDVYEPPVPAMAQLRTKERSEAIDQLVDAMTSPENLEAGAHVILDSLRDEEDFREVTPKDLVTELPLTVFPQLVHGVLRANAKLLGPLARKTEGLVARAAKAAETRVDEALRRAEGASAAS